MDEETMLPETIELDDEGYWDRQCPWEECGRPFKALFADWTEKVPDERALCPFCRHEAEPGDFNTPEQTEYFCQAAMAEMQRRLGRMLGGLDLDRWCRERYADPDARAVQREPQTGYSWKCVVGGVDRDIDMNDVARTQYGTGAYAVFVDGRWLAFRDANASPTPSPDQSPSEAPTTSSGDAIPTATAEASARWAAPGTYALGDGCAYTWDGQRWTDVYCQRAIDEGWAPGCYGPFADGLTHYWDGNDFTDVGCGGQPPTTDEEATGAPPPTAMAIGWHDEFNDGCQYYWDGQTWSQARCQRAIDEGWAPGRYGPFANGCSYDWDGAQFSNPSCP